MTRRAAGAVTGRFQPFHLQHLELVIHALTLAKRVIVGITNPDRRSLRRDEASAHRHRDDANPFSYFERLEMVSASLAAAGLEADSYRIVPFPLDVPDLWSNYIPLDSVQIVRVFSDWEREKARRLKAAGYPVEILEGDTTRRISATDIRAAIAAEETWTHWVPEGTRRVLAGWDSMQIRRRFLKDRRG